MNVKLRTENHLEFLSLTGGCTGSYESTLVKMPHCWKSHDTAPIVFLKHYASNNLCMRGFRKFKKVGPENFLVINVFTEGRTDLPLEAIGPEGSNCFSRGSVPVILRRHIATCDFLGDSTDPCPSSESAHAVVLFF